MKECIIAFKGKNNASYILANYLCENPHLLTNSFKGLRKDIEALDDNFDFVLMFGIDKMLKNTIRIEAVAEIENCRLSSSVDLSDISTRLSNAGIDNYISTDPTHYLCNEAYWYALKKFNGNAVFIHIPSIKNICDEFLDKMKAAFAKTAKASFL